MIMSAIIKRSRLNESWSLELPVSSENSVVPSAERVETERSPFLSEHPQSSDDDHLASDEKIEALTAKLTDLKNEREAQYASLSEGIESKLRDDFEQKYISKMDMLSTLIEEVRNSAAAKIDSLENLSLLLASEALSKIFADKKNYSMLVSDYVSAQCKLLREDIEVNVRLSADDFQSSEKDLTPLQSRVSENVKFQVSEDIMSGQCVLSFEHDNIELNLPEYWDELTVKFRDMVHM